MKKIFFAFLATVLLSTSCQSKGIEGEWYGIHQGGPVTVTFKDNVLSLISEASSSMNMKSPYRLNETTDPVQIIIDEAAGMSGAGILKTDGSTLDLYVVFGMPGQVKAPGSFDEPNYNPAAMRLRLSRDRSVIDNAMPQKEVPEEAALAFERNRRLGKGINLNAVFDGLSGDRPIRLEQIRDIADKGFESLRIPIRWSDHTAKKAPYTIDEKFMARVDEVVDAALECGLAVSLDLHYYPTISFAGRDELSNEENITRFYSIWEQLSEHYKDYPDELYFDLMNEPSLALSPERWNEMADKALKIIRRNNPDRTVIIMTPSLGQHWTIGLLDLPEDDWNIIVEGHYYLPHLFTHQGLEYAMAGHCLGMKWTGTEEEKAAIINDLAFLKKWSDRNGRPINIGEYGVCALADEDSRYNWFSFFHEQLAEYGFSSNTWCYHRDTFSIFDEKSGRWNERLLKTFNF